MDRWDEVHERFSFFKDLTIEEKERFEDDVLTCKTDKEVRDNWGGISTAEFMRVCSILKLKRPALRRKQYYDAVFTWAASRTLTDRTLSFISGIPLGAIKYSKKVLLYRPRFKPLPLKTLEAHLVYIEQLSNFIEDCNIDYSLIPDQKDCRENWKK